MKTKICYYLACLVMLLSTLNIHAQQKLWGFDETGVYSLNKDGSDFTYFCKQSYDNDAVTDLFYTSRHYLQGVITDQTSTLFQMADDGDEYLKLFRFSSSPSGKIVEHSDHYLYGYAADTLFKIKPDGTGFTNLYVNATGERNLSAGLLDDGNYIYGIVAGWLFKYTPATNQYQNIFHFTDLSYVSSLCFGADGSFYGIGKNPHTVVFKIAADGSSYSILHDFNDVIYIKNVNVFYWPTGNLVGTIENWPATTNSIFKLTTDGTQFTELTNRNTEPIKFIESENIKIHNDYISDFSDGNVKGLYQDYTGTQNGKYFITKGQYNMMTSVEQALPESKVILTVTDINIGYESTGSLVKNDHNELFSATIFNAVYKGGNFFKVSSAGVKMLARIEEGGKSIDGNGLSVYQDWLFGTVSTNVGNILRINQDGTGLEKIYQFKGPDGRNPYGKIIPGGDGYMYGMTYSGGVNNQGVIYRLKPDGTGFQKLYDFSTAMGKTPYGHLLNLGDGYLYGMTLTGGTSNAGVIFKIKKDGTGYTKLYDFDTAHGAKPYGSLRASINGSLYGMTSNGGTKKNGVIFKINPNGSGFEVIYNLNATANPKDDLVEDSDGVLYGIGGNSIFRLNNDGSNFQILATVYGGKFPSLLLVDSNKLTPDVYVKSPADSAINININTDLVIRTGQVGSSFTIELSKTLDFSSLVFSQTAATTVFDIPTLESNTTYYTRVKTNIYPLYGKTTSFKTKESIKRIWGDLSGAEGSIYHVNLDGSGFVTFIDTRNGNPDFYNRPENITQLSDGSIIGTTSYGGSQGWGDMFKIDVNGFSKLHDWEQYANGSFVQFAEGNDGYIHGVGITATSPGRLLKTLPDGGNFQTIFFNKYGFSPAGYLTKASDGIIYGMSVGNGPGWIYKIKSDYSGIEQIFTFSSGATGKKPQGELTEGPDGFLYGMLTQGGSHNKGTVFKVSRDMQQFIKLHDFNGTDGWSPKGGVVFDNVGYFYGITAVGGSNGKGVVYKMYKDGSGFTILYNITEGHGPEGHLLLDKDHILYGAVIGNSYDGGFLFGMNTDGTGYHKLIDFPAGDYSYPQGRLLLIDETFDPPQPLLAAARVSQPSETTPVVNNNISVFPNPSTNDFTVEVKSTETESLDFVLYDLQGATLQRSKGTSNETTKLGRELKPGVYILRVKGSNNTSAMKRLVKQ